MWGDMVTNMKLCVVFEKKAASYSLLTYYNFNYLFIYLFGN